jgi:hypothetical protein
MIDLARIELLIAGKETPTDLGEEMFLSAYTKGTEGELLFTFLIGLEETLDKLTVDELHLLVLGYAMGQHDLETAELELGNNKEPKKIH